MTDTTTAKPADNTLAQVTALPGMSMAELKALWRRLNDTEPPPWNRRFLVDRLAYRIQELAHGGLGPVAVARLDALADRLDGKDPRPAKRPEPARPVAGTRLVREWQGVAYTVTVTRDGYELGGRPYKSLSAAARAITGTRWNGPVFFGLHRSGAA